MTKHFLYYLHTLLSSLVLPLSNEMCTLACRYHFQLSSPTGLVENFSGQTENSLERSQVPNKL